MNTSDLMKKLDEVEVVIGPDYVGSMVGMNNSGDYVVTMVIRGPNLQSADTPDSVESEVQEWISNEQQEAESIVSDFIRRMTQDQDNG